MGPINFSEFPPPLTLYILNCIMNCGLCSAMYIFHLVLCYDMICFFVVSINIYLTWLGLTWSRMFHSNVQGSCGWLNLNSAQIKHLLNRTVEQKYDVAPIALCTSRNFLLQKIMLEKLARQPRIIRRNWACDMSRWLWEWWVPLNIIHYFIDISFSNLKSITNIIIIIIIISIFFIILIVVIV